MWLSATYTCIHTVLMTWLTIASVPEAATPNQIAPSKNAVYHDAVCTSICCGEVYSAVTQWEKITQYLCRSHSSFNSCQNGVQYRYRRVLL